MHHAADIAGFVVSTAVFLGCEAVLGALSFGVGAVAGAVGGMVSYGTYPAPAHPTRFCGSGASLPWPRSQRCLMVPRPRLLGFGGRHNGSEGR